MKGWLDFLLKPHIALLIFFVYCVGYLVFLDEEGSLENGFLHWGPSTDPQHPTVFLGIKLDTWHKVLLVYAISFLTELMSQYYGVAMGQNFHVPLQDPDLPAPYGFKGTLTMLTFDTLLHFFFQIVDILLILTQQLQFMLPALVAELLANGLDTYLTLSQKKGL